MQADLRSQLVDKTMVGDLRKAIPWWVRIGVKVVLARLPVPYEFWKKMRLFEHGDMNQPERAWDNFLHHARVAGVLDEKSPSLRLKVKDDGYSVLELGPGDSLFSAVIARSLGASRCWLVDAADYASTDMAAYAGLFHLLRSKDARPISCEPISLANILHACGAEYLTNGVKSLAQVPSCSVNFCFSNAVLEHIPKAEFALMLSELRRILKPEGVCIHRVDLRDHLGGGLNNLRFSEAKWESPLFRNSGFYTNRIRFDEMMTMFEVAGFEFHLPRVTRWERMPLPRQAFDAAFRQLPDEDLLVSGFDVVLKCAG